MNKVKLLAMVLSMVIFSSESLAKKKLYKWVDENGKVTYSDQVPPDQIKKGHQELNKDGVVLEEIEDALTDEQVAAIKQAKILANEKAKAAEEAEKVRQNIMKAYTNENEIIRLKDERVSALNRNIEQARQSLEFQKISLDQILARAADSERNGEEISSALKSRIVSIEEKIKYQKKFITVKTEEIEKVITKFEGDLKTYRNAKGIE